MFKLTGAYELGSQNSNPIELLYSCFIRFFKTYEVYKLMRSIQFLLCFEFCIYSAILVLYKSVYFKRLSSFMCMTCYYSQLEAPHKRSSIFLWHWHRDSIFLRYSDLKPHVIMFHEIGFHSTAKYTLNRCYFPIRVVSTVHMGSFFSVWAIEFFFSLGITCV